MDFTKLYMRHVREVHEGTAWIEMPLAAVIRYGWSRHVVEIDAGTAHLHLPLGDIEDAPRCAECTKPTIDLVEVTDDATGDREWRCAECVPRRYGVAS